MINIIYYLLVIFNYEISYDFIPPNPIPKFYDFEAGDPKKIIKLNYKIDKKYLDKHKVFFSLLTENYSKEKGHETFVKINFYNPNLKINNFTTKNFINNKHSYMMFKYDDTINIIVKDSSSIFNGLVTLNKILKKNDGILGDGYLIDWPDIKNRVFHFKISKNLTFDDAYKILKKIRLQNYNNLIVQLQDVNFNSLEKINNDKFWNKESLLKLKNISKEFNIEFIPELKLLTHQEKLFRKNYPELMYNSQTYNPENNKTKNKIEQLLIEVIETLNPKIIHIGHDEASGVIERHNKKKDLNPNEKPISAEQFKSSILFLHSFLKKENVQIWMWGDMFLNREKYSNMFKWSNHGNIEFEKIIDDLPRDIIICDWHYFDNQQEFPSSMFFIKNGYKTFGATWKKHITIINFSNYIFSLNRNENGMIATSWRYVGKNDWEKVDDIICFSAQKFWNTK